jgi:ankyrin repeat protein
MRAYIASIAFVVMAAPAMADSAAHLAGAAEQNDAAAVRALLGEGADVNAPQADGMTALHWAVYHDSVDLAQRLVEAGANVAAENRYGVAPLSIACQNGNERVVQLLLDGGADPNTTIAGGETALITASRTGRPGPVEALLARGADVNATERKGQTALMWAAAEGNVQAVEALLAAGADDRARLSSGFTALFFAVREGRTEVALRLLEAGGDVNKAMREGRRRSDRGPTPLILAVENGHFETAVALLDAGADPNAHPEGYTALHAIVSVRKPIRGDPDPPPRGSGKLSSLDFVRVLASRGADLDLRLEDGSSGRGRFTTTGSTPFLLAARASDAPLVRLLLELGADPIIPNADNCTPLLAAAGVGALGDGEESAGTEEEAIETVGLLLELGADVNAVDNNGETAMHGAAYQSLAKLVQVLADRGAKVDVWNRPNKWTWTPLHIARGYRPGNFRPAPDTIAAIESVMRAHGVEPSEAPPRNVGGPIYGPSPEPAPVQKKQADLPGQPPSPRP